MIALSTITLLTILLSFCAVVIWKLLRSFLLGGGLGLAAFCIVLLSLLTGLWWQMVKLLQPYL